MPHLTEAEEHTLRGEIVAYIATVALCGNVFDRRRKFNSRNDFLERCGATVGTGATKKREIRFVEAELLLIDDDATEGFDDCPVPNITYGLHMFHEFVDQRPDGGNSDRSFTDLVLQLRSKILNAPTFLSGRAVVEKRLTEPDETEFRQFGADTFTDVVGHFQDLQMRVKVYDSAP